MLSNYTDDELREELKRRAKERRKALANKPTEYIYLKGIVRQIDNIACHYHNGVKYKAYTWWKFKVLDFECDEPRVINWCFHCNEFKCALPKHKAPKVGDKVLIKIRKTKNLSPYNVKNSKIIEVINQ